MTPPTQRRGSVALLVLTLLVLSVDTAHAVQRGPTQRQRVDRTRSAVVTAHASVVALRGARTQRTSLPTRRAHPGPRPAPRTRVTQRHAPPRRHARPVARITGPTGWAPLDIAIARIPTYRPGSAIWLVSNRYGHWGTADWYRATLYISPQVPVARLYDVAVHEWSHELSVLDYHGDVAAAVGAMNSVFGGSGLVGAERAADCMAKLQGASWTHYTPCLDHGWRRAAARLLAGQQL